MKTSDPLRWDHHLVSNLRAPITQLRGPVTQKNTDIIKTLITLSNLNLMSPLRVVSSLASSWCADVVITALVYPSLHITLYADILFNVPNYDKLRFIIPLSDSLSFYHYVINYIDVFEDSRCRINIQNSRVRNKLNWCITTHQMGEQRHGNVKCFPTCFPSPALSFRNDISKVNKPLTFKRFPAHRL